MRIAFLPLAGVLVIYPFFASGESYDCPEVPVSEAEENELLAAAMETLSPEQQSQGFSSTEVSKCSLDVNFDGDPPYVATEQHIVFYGYFPYLVRDDDYRERMAVECRKNLELRDGDTVRESAICRDDHQKHLVYPSIDNELRLRGDVTKAEAQAYLSYIRERIDDRTVTAFLTKKDFERISGMNVNYRKGRRVFSAYISSGGGILYLNANAVQGNSIAFEALEADQIMY